MTIALVNRFVPPDGAPTAVSLARLGRLLVKRLPSLDWRLIGVGRSYAGGGASGENLWRRAANSWRDGQRLAQEAADCSAVLSLTDPPFLSYHLGRQLSADQFWCEWTMDLYPQALTAMLGLTPSPPCRPRRRPPDMRLCLGPRQAAFIAAGEQRPPPFLICPAGVCDALSPPPPRKSENPIRLVYAGNLGRAHWDDALPELARLSDPTRFRLLVAAYGVRAKAVRTKLMGFPHVEWRDTPLNADELNAADVHVVSLRKNWTHVCAPSKAVSALCRGRPLLFFGAANADAWKWANGAGWRIDPCRDAARRMLPAVLAELLVPERLNAFTERAMIAGEKLRTVEGNAADVLAERLSERIGRRL